MIRNYFIVAVRNVLRYKTYSLINISGLAVGIACCILVLLFIQHEFSYDRHHKKADRIYKVLRKKQRPDGEKYYTIGTLGPVGPTMQQDFPEVERATRFVNRSMLVRYDNTEFTERVIVADPEFLNIFDYPLIKGNPKGLQTPFTAFITQQLAHRLFGQDDPIGKVVSIDYKWFKSDFTVQGILRDIPESITWEFECDLLTTTMAGANVPYGQNSNWQHRLWEAWWPESNLHPMLTYVLLKPNASASDLSTKLPEFALRYLGEKVGSVERYELAPLTRLYLYGRHDYKGLDWPKDVKPLGDYRKSYTFGIIGIFVLTIACINFMNLATARSARRAREVGLRKVVGAYRAQIARQFLSESILLSVIALILALGLTELLLPVVNGYLGIHLSTEPLLLLVFLGLALIVGLISGSYPAFFLSSFHPTAVLASTPHIKGGHATVRRGLVVVQFAISIVLIVGTLVAFQQTEYMRNTDIGFSRDARLVIPLSQQDPEMRKRALSFKQRVLQHASILGATASLSPPGWEDDISMRPLSANGLDKPVDVHILYADHDFLGVYDIALIDGRNFVPQDQPIPTPGVPPNYKILINETAARELGDIHPGDRVKLFDLSVEVIGIFKDFHNRSLHHPVRPLMFIYLPNFDFVTVHFNTQNLSAVMAHLESVWKEFIPTRPFEYQFLDDYLDQFYRNEFKLRQLYMACTGLAIFIACLGLLGLIAYTGEVRTREIGIRKVLGASGWSIVGLLTREFIVLVCIASSLAWPVAWFVMNTWLQNFAYRIDLNLGFFVISTVAALIITLLTISFQALKVARTNPIDALRSE